MKLIDELVKLKKLDINDRIFLPGSAGNMSEWYERADLFVLSSHVEGFPNVLLEAQVLKKFIISTDCPTGPREILLNGKGGFLFEVGNYKKLAEQILFFSKNKFIEIKCIQKNIKKDLSENKVTIDLIQSLVCKFFKISKSEMLSSRRSRYLVRPRQTAIYLTKILTSKSLPEIGREFANRDHTTVIHSIKTIENLKKNDPDLCSSIDNLKNQILYNKSNEI